MASLLKLGGTTIRKPKTFEIERYNITKSGRLASGKMVMDLIAKKRKFQFAYDVIDSINYDKILAVIDSDNMFFGIEYEENNVIKTAMVYVGSIKSKKFREGNIWYWKDFNFNLIEQ
jgi:hypothetical protein